MTSKIPMLFSLVLLCVLAVPCEAVPLGMFLKVDGIDGDSEQIRSYSDILGFEIGVRFEQGLTRRGETIFSDMKVSKIVDSASPVFFGNLLLGKVAPNAMVDVRRTNDDKLVPYVLWEFENVLMTLYETGADVPDEEVAEMVAFNFEKVKYSFYPPQPDGSAGTPVSFEWNLETGTTSITGNLSDLQFITNAGVAVPEPTTLTMSATVMIGGLAARRRRNC